MQTIKNLLALGITLGLSDREAFVKKVEGVIEEYHKNPEKAEQWSETVVKYLEELKDDFRMQRNISSSISDSLSKEDIQQLIKAVQELTKELQHQKKG